jgi:RNA polymerase sigma factor (sigma-70 family)
MNQHLQVRRWYQEWFKDVLRFFGRRGQSRADAQDLAQEVYLRLLRAENLTVVNHPRAYVHRIAANVLAEWTVRAPQAKPHGPEGLEDLLDPGDLTEELDTALRQQAVTAAVQQLPKLLRAALVLHCQEALTYPQIAVRLGASERMVKRYLKKAYAQLRVELEQHDVGAEGPQRSKA